MPVEPLEQRRKLLERAPDRAAGAREFSISNHVSRRSARGFGASAAHVALEPRLEARAEMRADVGR